MSFSKEDLLKKVDSYDIINHYLKPYHNTDRLLAGKNISNPFLAENQKTPSFNIFPTMGSGEWRFKDFATGDEGSCFDLVMKLNNLKFPEALQKINSDLNLMLDTSQKFDNSNKHTVVEKPTFRVKTKPFDQIEIQFWLKYGIDVHTLKRFNVSSLAEFSTTSKSGNPYTIRSSQDNFIFAYENTNWVKLYKPLDDKKYKFHYLGTKDQEFIFGWEQLPENDELLIITGGEKDVMALSAKNFNAITLNSETATMPKSIIDNLKLRFKNILVLYDNDDTGLKHSNLLAVAHGLHRLVLPTIKNNGKDISDYFATGESLENLKYLIEETLKTTPPIELDIEKSVYNAVELLARGEIEQRYLMHPIFPQKGSAVLAGKPDTGKSQFARQLCIQIALGETNFIDFELNPVHNRSIYVATEDNEDATRFLLYKQFNGLEKQAVENLRFIFADTMNQEEIIKNLNEQLSLQPVDLVVIDSFGDIFQGNDSNNNMAMRNTVKTFDKIGKEHNCLVLFVHHINKAAYRVAPGQEHIQGGAGLVQKVRLAIVLSEGEGNTRYFTVVKGNYCPKMYKENSLQLDFSEESFLFTNSGKLIPTAELGTKPELNNKDEKYNELVDIAEAIFKNNVVNYGNFVKEFCQITGKSVPTAKRAHSNLVKLEIIEKCNGAYRIKEKSSDDNNLDNDEDDVDVPF
ncbi:AAA family ATPase [Mariniflexile maritimum]|uniref:AAA family ATPase n=1 Tax=Mariniflexile maritimum TaxID=2682493 RepID=UPI0012F69341|nr:AAA family ATPase [Mariniflexile maritimum]